jgi:hypothetical protein
MTRNSDAARALALAWLCGALLALFPLSARAVGDEAGARVLFGEARKLVAAGKYQEACPKFVDSYRLDPGIGTNFNLADCLEHIGRTASAWARFLDVAAATKAAGQPERERVARARAAALEPRLPRISIQVQSPAPDLVVLRDDVRVEAPSWGMAVPVDPGSHQIEASAPDRKLWAKTVEVPALPATVEVLVPALELAAPAQAPVAPPGVVSLGPAAGKGPEGLVVAHEERRRWSRPVIVLGSVGLAALVAGVVYGIKFEIDNGDAQQICSSMTTATNCPAPDQLKHSTLVDAAYTDRTVELLSFGVGTAALVTAGYLWWQDARHHAHRSETQLSFAPLAPGFPGLALSGVW